ncbi:hypothetical protein D3C80_1648310 [compost metagenome]
MVHYTHVGRQFFRQIVTLPQQTDAFQVFPGAFGVLTAQLIAPCAGMGIQVQEGFVFFFQRFNDQALNGVLEHVGVVAGVETVAVT